MKLVPIVAAALPLTPTASVSAQNVGQSAPRTEFVAYNLVAAEMGRCVLKKDRRRAITIAGSNPAIPANRTLGDEIRPSLVGCLKNAPSATVSIFYLRGAIAEALLVENDAALLKMVNTRLPVAPVRVEAANDNPAAATISCAVNADPADAGAMIAARAASVEELTAFRKLVPSLQACAPASGEVKLRRPTVRPEVAIALYQLSRGSADPMSSNGAN